jgi:glycosyltransferase involved in cell wall biosynthesis/MoaA/NifB/PqqE/SkfB family radical SAM enzyme
LIQKKSGINKLFPVRTVLDKTVVVHVILSLEIGGMEQVVVDLVKTIDRSRFKPEIVCVQRLGPLAGELESTGITVVELPPMVPMLSFLYPAALVTAIRRAGADVVHVHSGCWFKGAMAARICGVKRVIYTLHGARYARTWLFKLMERIAAKFTSRIVVVSHDLAAQLRHAGHIPMEKVSVIINGINTEKFSAIPLRSHAGTIRIGVIARLEPVKDLGTLLRAMRILFDEGADATLDLIGDGSERADLERLSMELGITDRVRFFGFQRDTPQRLADIDIFALSSLSEGTSISILEAMAAGKPIVATAVGGIPALVEEGKNGFLVPSSDPAAFARALLWLIRDEDLRERMGEENRLKAQKEYGLMPMTIQYEKLYASYEDNILSIDSLVQKIRGKCNQLLARTSMQTGLNLNKPTYVCAKMTMRCNSRCAHCNIWQMTFGDLELSAEEWFSVLNDLRGWLGRYRMVFTGGEALLRDDMPEILTHAAGLGISVELLSNGIMIDEVLARKIVATGIDQITISYDGMTPEVHDRFRGGAGFHAATTSAIYSLVRERREQMVPLRILLKTVISADNLHELAAIARWAGEQGLEVQYQPIEQNYGEEQNPSWYSQSPLWINDVVSLKKQLNALRQMKEHGKSAIANSHEDFDLFQRYFEYPETMMGTIQVHDKKVRNSHCPHAVGNFVIESNGDVRMCFKMGPIGNVGSTTPATIWRERQRCWAGPCDYR